MKTVCVYCGSSSGSDPLYAEQAALVGRLLAESGRTLVYGGGDVGLMGVVSDAAMSAGGKVIGVITRALVEKEVAHHGLTKLHIVESMHERKAMMADLSDGFLALPGGIGTLEEFFEAWTWAQLGLHAKPYALLNTAGFYDPLLTFLDQLVTKRFVKPEHRAMLLVHHDPRQLLEDMARERPQPLPKWIERSQT